MIGCKTKPEEMTFFTSLCTHSICTECYKISKNCATCQKLADDNLNTLMQKYDSNVNSEIAIVGDAIIDEEDDESDACSDDEEDDKNDDEDEYKAGARSQVSDSESDESPPIVIPWGCNKDDVDNMVSTFKLREQFAEKLEEMCKAANK